MQLRSRNSAEKIAELIVSDKRWTPENTEVRVYDRKNAEELLSDSPEARRIRFELSLIYQYAYVGQNSRIGNATGLPADSSKFRGASFWPGYKSPDDIPDRWATYIAKDIVGSPTGSVIVAMDGNTGTVVGSNLLIGWKEILGSYHKDLESTVKLMTRRVGADLLGQMGYGIDLTTIGNGSGKVLWVATLGDQTKRGFAGIAEWTSPELVDGRKIPIREKYWPEAGFVEITTLDGKEKPMRGIEWASAAKDKPRFGWEENQGIYAVMTFDPAKNPIKAVLRVAQEESPKPAAEAAQPSSGQGSGTYSFSAGQLSYEQRYSGAALRGSHNVV